LTITAGGKDRTDTKGDTGTEQPEGQVVQAWERHIRSADLQRHEVVAETAKKGRNNNKEHHQHTVVRDHHVPEVAVWRTLIKRRWEQTCTFKAHVLNAGVHQLHPHVNGKGDGQESDKTAYKQI